MAAKEPSNEKQPTGTKEVTDYEIRVKAMSLAIQHSRNCQSSTLIKLADAIRKFLNGNDVDELLKSLKNSLT